MQTKDLITLIISSTALIISIMSIWINYLKPFKLKVLNDAPTFSLYKMTPEMYGDGTGKVRWIPSFDIGFSFNNLGKQSGFIYDIRLSCVQIESQTKKELHFYPIWVVDYSKFQKLQTERFTWIDEAIIKDWFSTILPASSSKDFHVVLEGDRWDNKFSGTFKVTLEIYTSKVKRWVTIADYEWDVYESMFDDKSRYTLYDKDANNRRK